MSYCLFSMTEPTARKDHRCIWCGQKIPKGTKYARERSVFYGEMQNHHWHPECLKDSQVANADGEWEFMPYSNERPQTSAMLKGDDMCLQCEASGTLAGTGLCTNCSGLNDGYGTGKN